MQLNAHIYVFVCICIYISIYEKHSMALDDCLTGLVLAQIRTG